MTHSCIICSFASWHFYTCVGGRNNSLPADPKAKCDSFTLLVSLKHSYKYIFSKPSCFCLYQQLNMWQYSGNVQSIKHLYYQCSKPNMVHFIACHYHHRILLPSVVSRPMYLIASVLVAHTRYKQYWDLPTVRQIESFIPVSYGLCFQYYRLYF